MTYNASNLTIILEAMPVNWTNISTTISMTYNLTIGRPHQGRLPISAAGDPDNSVRRSGFAFPFSNVSVADEPSFGDESWNLSCTECSLRGALDMEVDIAVRLGLPRAVRFSVEPQGLRATLDLHANIQNEKHRLFNPKPISFGPWPVSHASIEIPDILAFGPLLKFEIGANASIQGQANFDFGLTADIPNSAHAVWELPKNRGARHRASAEKYIPYGIRTMLPSNSTSTLTAR